MADSSPSLIQSWAALGGIGAITAFLGWITGHRLAPSQIKQNEAQAQATLVDAAAKVNEIAERTFSRVISQMEERIKDLETHGEERGARLDELSVKVDAQAMRLKIFEADAKKVPYAKWRTDRHGVFMYVSDRFATLFLAGKHLTPEAIVGKTRGEIFTPEFLSILDALDAKLLTSRDDMATICGHHLPGDPRRYLLYKYIIQDESGLVAFYAGGMLPMEKGGCNEVGVTTR